MKKFFYGLIICFIFFMIIFVYMIYNDLFCFFKEGKSLNYQKEINSIEVYSSNDIEFIKGERKIIIKDKNDIEKFRSYLNSLEVVELEDSYFLRYDGDHTEQGYFTTDISLEKDVPADEGFVFLAKHYLIYFDGEKKSQTKYYYIKNAECDKNGKNKVYYFLYDLINK